jgi:hypothetical protein
MPAGANGVFEAAGVLPSDVMRSLGVATSFWYMAACVGDSVVKGWWKGDGQALGVLGIVGKGYDGVRRACPAGVAGTLPRMVRDDDSVDSVCDVASGLALVAMGLAKAPSRVGDMFEVAVGSSLMGEMRRMPCMADVAALLTRARCCCCSTFNCRLRNRSISISSGDAFPDDKSLSTSKAFRPSTTSSAASDSLPASTCFFAFTFTVVGSP